MNGVLWDSVNGVWIGLFVFYLMLLVFCVRNEM